LGRWSRAAILLLLAAAPPLQAQDSTLVQRLGLDRLQFVSLGAAVGRIRPSQVSPTQLYAITADYGEVARNWRLVFDVSYWESQLNASAVTRFLDSLRTNIVDPTNDYAILSSDIPIYDVTFGGGVRWQTTKAVALRPYGGVGAAAHVINAEGRLIKGTFVERALDNISAGFFGNAGVLFRPWGRVIFDAQARVDLLSGFRSIQVRGGGQYFFGPAPRRQP
jgi:hypothetical protein